MGTTSGPFPFSGGGPPVEVEVTRSGTIAVTDYSGDQRRPTYTSNPTLGKNSSTQSSGESEEKRHSTIPYCIWLLDYHLQVYCDYQQKAAMWISWSDDNPGRRYLKCYRAQVGGCAFMCWYEHRHDAFLQTLLVDLRNVVWSLKKEKTTLNEALGEATARLDLMEKKLAVMKKEEEDKVDALKSEKEDLKVEVRKLEVEKTGLKVSCVFFVAIVLFMWIGNQ
ncbi:hypothetical protein QOZ80_2BG0179280 [Eleusine coracana subsp. coracana]|nr:hypothetical protein QOZ80_2BG0179280 [Eleusine coracana subsp. coracana]